MAIRFLQTLILIAWLTTSGEVVRRAYFPDESRFPEVSVKRVVEQYFDDGQPSDLLVLREARVLGRLSVGPRVTGELREIFFTGQVNPEVWEGAGRLLGVMTFNGSMTFDAGYQLERLRFMIRVPRWELVSLVTWDLATQQLLYQVERAGQVLFDSTDPAGSRGAWERLQVMAKSAGLDVATIMEALPTQDSLPATTLTCRHGKFQVLQRGYNGFLLIFRLAGEVKIRFLLTETGELVRIEGIPGLDILGETLTPEEWLRATISETGL